MIRATDMLIAGKRLTRPQTPGASISGSNAAMKGKTAPDFQLKDLDGKTVEWGQTPVRAVVPVVMRSALAAERQATRFAAAGRHGVVLRLGLLDGPGTGHDQPNAALGASLHTVDAGRALLAALTVPSGIYNVCRDGEPVSHRRFTEATGWRPRH